MPEMMKAWQWFNFARRLPVLRSKSFLPWIAGGAVASAVVMYARRRGLLRRFTGFGRGGGGPSARRWSRYSHGARTSHPA